MHIYFIRHGETVYNKKNLLQGQIDGALTERGIEQAGKIGLFLKDQKAVIDQIISSPLGRARSTAKIIGNKIQKNAIIDKRLTEVCYGEWEGRSKEELRKLPLWKEREKNMFSFVHPGSFDGVKGDSYEDQNRKFRKFIGSIIKIKKNYLIVTHLGICRAAKAYFCQNIHPEYTKITHKNDEVFYVRIETGKIYCRSILI